MPIHVSDPPPLPAFVEVFEQMQALHLKLWDAHQVVLQGISPRSGLERPNKSKAVSEVSMEHVESDNPNAEPLSARMSRKLMQKVKKASHTMDTKIEHSDSVDILCLRPEWDVKDEKLKELKRVQRRLSAGSISTTVRSKRTRQYLLKTEQNQEHPCFVVSPHSCTRICWDVLVMFAILLEIFASPLQLYHLPDVPRGILNVLQWILTSFWILDIPASFFTATYINDTLHYQLADIRREYLRTWFPFDMLMLLPDVVVVFLQIYDGPAGVIRLARIRRLLRLGRFIQILRMWKMMDRYKLSRGTPLACGEDPRCLVQSVVYMTLSLFAAVHVLGSLWFAAGDTPGGWVIEEALHDMQLTRQYTRSMEWAIAKLPPSSLRITVGLNTPPERWLGIAGTCLAMLCGSVFLSYVTNAMADFAKSRVRTREILWSVQKYCGSHGISSVYTMQIKRYVEREHRRNELGRHMQLLKTLPDGMVRELFQEAHSSILHSHAFFREIGEGDSSMEMNLCSNAVSEIHVLAGDVIFDLSNRPKGMYFLAQGVGIYFHSCSPPIGAAREDKNGTINGSTSSILPSLFPKKVRSRLDIHTLQTIIECGEHLAEPALWISSWRHQGHLQATLDARAVLVSTEQLFKVLQDYASAFADAILYARCFVKEMNHSSQRQEGLTDLPFQIRPRTRSPSGINLRSGQVLPESSGAAARDFFLP